LCDKFPLSAVGVEIKDNCDQADDDLDLDQWFDEGAIGYPTKDCCFPPLGNGEGEEEEDGYFENHYVVKH